MIVALSLNSFSNWRSVDWSCDSICHPSSFNQKSALFTYCPTRRAFISIGSRGSFGVGNSHLKIASMFQNLVRLSRGAARGTPRYSDRRAFSYVSTHKAFPATMYLFQIHRDSRLFDRAFEQDDWEYEDGVEVSKDGLVHPNITMDCMRSQISILTMLTCTVSNGALLMPNTFFMQELTRRSFDNYFDNLENGQPEAEPHYLCIPKGDQISQSS